jgi:DNA-binding transcriptional ArsR family regulator
MSERGRRGAGRGASSVASRGVDESLRVELHELTSTLCHALNDPKRLVILHLLGEGPSSVGTLAEQVGATVANVSQHLAVLRERGLVETERDGLNVIYSLRYPELLDAIDGLRAVLRSEMRRRGALGD